MSPRSTPRCRQTAAIVAEPIQGEGGVRPLSPEFAAAIDARLHAHRRAADRRRDPVRPRPHRRAVLLPVARLTPDLVTVGKALGVGCAGWRGPGRRPGRRPVFAGDHGTTYGGNLLATRAALFVLEQLQDTAAARPRCSAPASTSRAALRDLGRAPSGDHRGPRRRVMRGARTGVDARRWSKGAARRPDCEPHRRAVVRMLPPFTVTAAEIDEAVGILDGCWPACRGGANDDAERRAVVRAHAHRTDRGRRRHVATGFRAAGLHCGIKANGKPDLSLVVSDGPATAAGVFTLNLAKAAPVLAARRT